MSKLIQLTTSLTWLLMFSLAFIIMNKIIHPIILMLMTVVFNITLCMYISTWKPNYMFSIIAFLISISGLLIIFMYFSSLVANDSMLPTINMKSITILTLSFASSLSFLSTHNILIMTQFGHSFLDSDPLMSMNSSKFLNISSLYTYPFNNLTLLSMIYLLAAFIIIIKINSSTHAHPMRKINK